jgi:hypothetical protein
VFESPLNVKATKYRWDSTIGSLTSVYEPPTPPYNVPEFIQKTLFCEETMLRAPVVENGVIQAAIEYWLPEIG